MRIRPQVINLLVGRSSPSYAFDRAGRLIGCFEDGVSYRRGLDNRVLAKRTGAGGRRSREWLPDAAAGALLARAYALGASAAEAAGDPRLDVLRGWDARRLAEDAARFAEIYRPVSILPPDQYLALVLQATVGCSYNRCTFCSFYRDRPFRITDAGAFRVHVRAVRDFFGPAIGLRRSVFLADANALVAPSARVNDWFDVIEEEEILRAGGIHSFIDAFDVGRKTVAEWRALAGRGLRRLYLGMESGDDALLEFLRKPGGTEDVLEAVRTLKAAGLAVSVIVMAGIGGGTFEASHVDRTASLLSRMPLDQRDIVYVSPFVEQEGSEYGLLAEAKGIRALTAAEIDRQARALRLAYRPAKAGVAPTWSRYDIREFVY